jgi:hypothetical protein
MITKQCVICSFFRAEADSGEGGGVVWGDKEIKQVYVAKGIHLQIYLP